MVPILKTGHKIWRIQMFVVILLRSQIVLDDQRIRARKVCNCCRKKISACVERRGVVFWIIRRVSLSTKLCFDLVLALRVKEIVSTKGIVAIGSTDQEPRVGDDGENSDVVLAVFGALPLDITSSFVLCVARPNDSLELEIGLIFEKY